MGNSATSYETTQKEAPAASIGSSAGRFARALWCACACVYGLGRIGGRSALIQQLRQLQINNVIATQLKSTQITCMAGQLKPTQRICTAGQLKLTRTLCTAGQLTR
eukprot:6176662-Pleurochrysis_carterae.AAC.3